MEYPVIDAFAPSTFLRSTSRKVDVLVSARILVYNVCAHINHGGWEYNPDNAHQESNVMVAVDLQKGPLSVACFSLDQRGKAEEERKHVMEDQSGNSWWYDVCYVFCYQCKVWLLEGMDTKDEEEANARKKRK